MQPSRILAFLCYLVPVVSSLLVMLVGRRNALALYHACQALAIFVGSIVVVPLIWIGLGWILLFIPIAGPVFAAGLFGVVIAAGMAAVVGLVIGIINALSARFTPVPVFGGWGNRLFLQLYRP